MSFQFKEPGFVTATERLKKAEERRRRYAAQSLPFHVSFLDDVAVGILPVDLVVIGAQTGAGKTTLGAIISQTSAAQGTRVAYFALEAFEGEIESRMLYREMARLAWEREICGRHSFTYAHWQHGRCDAVSALVYEDALRVVGEKAGTLKTFYRESRFTADDLVRSMAAVQAETDLIVVDHLHFIDNEAHDENRGTKAIVKAMSDAVVDTETPVIAIAHLRKKDSREQRIVPTLNDFHGTSDITKIATKAVILAPAYDQPSSDPYIARTYMRAGKDRMVGEKSVTALVEFDLRSNTYRQKYRLGTLGKSGKEWLELPGARIPWWAQGAQKETL